MALSKPAFARRRSGASAGQEAGAAASAGAPVAFWLLLLTAGTPWLRYATAWGPIYPGQWLLVPTLAWALTRGPLALPDGRWKRPPLMPLAVFAGFVLALALLRRQWGTAVTLVPAAAALAAWAWAAYRLGRAGAPLGRFRTAAILFLAASLAVGVLAWLAQFRWPAACVLLNCDAAAPIPDAFRGGWYSNAQYMLALIALLPPVGGAFLESWRAGPRGPAQWLLTLVVAGAGLGLLAGMRWWGFLILALGLLLLGQALAADSQPADRLLLRGLVFFTVFSSIALYGTMSGYGTALLFPPGSARTLGVRHSLPSPVVLSSEAEVTETVQAVNTGSVALSASPERPLRLQALALFTPRSGGESRMAPAGEGSISRDLAPGEATDVTVRLRVPAWMNQGYLSWSAEDETGRSIGLAEGMHQGFRFVNGDYTPLSEGGDDALSALAARARVPALALPAGGPRRSLVEPVLSDAFDTLFFSPLWGQAGPSRPPGQVFDPARPFLLQVLYQYGLIGLGLVGWFLIDLMRRAVQLGFGRRTLAGLGWRLVPVSVPLLALLGLLSGEWGRFHSWWGCVLLGGYVQGVHARVFPQRQGAVGPAGWGQPARRIAAGLRALGAIARRPRRAAAWPRAAARGLRVPARAALFALRVPVALAGWMAPWVLRLRFRRRYRAGGRWKAPAPRRFPNRGRR